MKVFNSDAQPEYKKISWPLIGHFTLQQMKKLNGILTIA